MKAKRRAKRRALSLILFAAASGLEVSLDKLREALGSELGLTAKEHGLISLRYVKARKIIEDLRRIAEHLQKPD